jgi:hypothetical protein
VFSIKHGGLGTRKLIIASYVAALLLSLVVLSFGCKKEPGYPYRISLEEASKIIGAPFPIPTYLRSGFEIKGIYVLERHEYSEMLVLLISDEAVDEKKLSSKIKMYVTPYRRGQVGGLKLPGERFNIGDTEGVLVTRETTNDLWWILTHPEQPGQYELKLSAIKEIPKEELVKVARSVPQ